MTAKRFLWETRRCWICGHYGDCGHREPEVDMAQLRAKLRAELRALVVEIVARPAA